MEPDVVTVIDDDEPQPKKKGKRSRLKLQKEEKTDVKQIEAPKSLESTNKPGKYSTSTRQRVSNSMDRSCPDEQTFYKVGYIF